MYKRNSVLLSLGLCALFAVQARGDFLARLRARRIKRTTFVSAGNRRLAGFFDGLSPDPHWDAAKLLSSRKAPACEAGRNHGLLAWLSSVLQVTAHAQGGCQPVGCANNWSAPTSAYCPNCTSGTVPGSGSYYCNGTDYNGDTGCTGDNCSPSCNLTGCSISNCSCKDDGEACTTSDTCCGIDSNCIEGTCQSEY